MGGDSVKNLIALAALMAVIPLNSTAQCTLNGVEVPGDPELIEGTSSGDTIDCSGSSERHDIYGYGGNDLLIGSDYDDFIAGGSNDDTIYGGEGDDSIDGGGANDEIHGQGGNDFLFGGVGSSSAAGVGCELDPPPDAAGGFKIEKGGSGDDTIYGGEGNDCIDAGSGEDFVYGEGGNDRLEGGNHSDWLDGGPGDDHLDGGWHSDTCIGGGGNDEYISCETIDDTPAVCNDGTCNAGEDECNCPQDCGTPPGSETFMCTDSVDNDCDVDTDCDDTDCDSDPACAVPGCDNDGVCDPGEDCSSCSNDCSGRTKGKPSNRYCCGDGNQQTAEGDGSICDGNY